MTWEAEVNDRMSETPSDHLPNSPPIQLDEEDGNVGNQEYVSPPPTTALHSQRIVVGECSVLLATLVVMLLAKNMEY